MLLEASIIRTSHIKNYEYWFRCLHVIGHFLRQCVDFQQCLRYITLLKKTITASSVTVTGLTPKEVLNYVVN